MEISQVTSAFPFLFPNQERGESQVKGTGDINDVRAPELLTDEEAEAVLNETVNMIGSDRAAALSVHSGLSESRVFALLGL